MKNILKHLKRSIRERIDLYDTLVSVQLVKNESKNAIAPYNDETDKIAMDFLGAYAKDLVAFYYVVEGYPGVLPMRYRERLRRCCKAGVRLNFLDNIEKYELNWDSTKMKNQFRVLKNTDDEIAEKSMDRYKIHAYVDELQNRQRINDSIDYLTDADKSRGRACMTVSTLIVVIGERGESFDDSIKQIEAELHKLSLRASRILYNLPAILHSFAPFKVNNYADLKEYIPKQLLTDEILARVNAYTQGVVGYKGDYFGMDIYTGFPVIKFVKEKNDSAENWLITGETGSGKSFFIKVKLLELLANGFRGTIMDIEGFEYENLAKFIAKGSKVQTLTLAEGCGKYFDPVEIARATGVEEIDIERKIMSTNFTMAILRVLLKDVYSEFVEADTIVDDALRDVYKDAGVTDDSSTWENSKGLTLHTIYKRIQQSKASGVYESNRFQDALNAVLGKLGKYFEPDGTSASMFVDRVKVEDIIEADLVVCKFNMAGKSEQSLGSVFLTLMQLSAAQISHQRSIYSKYLGKYNFKVWEEFQRWGKFEGSDATIGVAVTGGRKLGDVNIIITNKVKDILTDDRFGLFDNIQSYMIGAIPDADTRRQLCERIGIKQLQSELDSIAKDTADLLNKDSVSRTKGVAVESPYSQAFLCYLDRNKIATTKMLVSKKWEKSGIFDTGVAVEGSKQ